MHNKFIISNILLKRMVLVFALTGSILIMLAALAEACSVCAYAAVERVLPPAWGWIIFSIIWFLALAASATARKEKLHCIPNFPLSLLLVIILIIIGLFVMGPAPIFLLFLAAIIGTIGTFFKKTGDGNPKFKHDIKVIRGVVLLSLLVLGSGSLYIRSTRTSSDFILRWLSTYPGKAALSDLLASGPEALPDLRVLVKKGESELVAKAAERLAVIGEPQIDVPLLLNVLSSTASSRVESAVRQLSGLELPEGTAIKVWREEWQKNLQQSTSKHK